MGPRSTVLSWFQAKMPKNKGHSDSTGVKEKNGRGLMGSHQVPGDLWIVLGLDPHGATVALVGPKKQ